MPCYKDQWLYKELEINCFQSPVSSRQPCEPLYSDNDDGYYFIYPDPSRVGGVYNQHRQEYAEFRNYIHLYAYMCHASLPMRI